jgi:hypothetical protein
MGAALTYARRYALFALVGIAGEDDLDAPDLLVEPSPAIQVAEGLDREAHNIRKPSNGSIHKPQQPKTVLAVEASAKIRDQMIGEIAQLKNGEDLALWAHRRLAAKNSLTTDDARAVEVAYQGVLEVASAAQLAEIAANDQAPARELERASAVVEAPLVEIAERPSESQVTPQYKTSRKRNKAHLAFVAAQPCLVCQRSPCDAHHLKFSQPRTLGRKVSDEFTVPLCRDHHRDLHRHGNEVAWWANHRIGALRVARDLWTTSPAVGQGPDAAGTPSESRE